MRLFVTALALTLAIAPSVYGAGMPDPNRKIQFDLEQLDEQGLYGPVDGKRSLSYEFCIPQDPAVIEQVMAIDPSLIMYLRSPGRIGCETGEVLAIGDTHQPHYREILNSLASLPEIEQIVQFFGE
jgi:hypothetical protein